NINYPIPILSSLTPNTTTAGSPDFILTVNGNGFGAGSIVNWKGSPIPTFFVSATRLMASVSASNVAVAGTAQVTVFNPAPGGGPSNPLTFPITAPPILSLTKTAPTASTTYPNPVSYQIVVTNAVGSSAAIGATVSDTLPAGSLISGAVSGSNGVSCTA